MDLTIEELLRYGRHLKTPEMGLAGQLKLKRSSVLIVGIGGLGSTSALCLAAAGVGRLTLADSDIVELGNVQRQVLHWTDDVGRPKLDSAAEKLAAVNPLVKIRACDTKISDSNSRELVEGHDLVIDGTDNFEARYVICRACVSAGVPHVYGAVSGFEGRVTVFDGGAGPCYTCMHPVPPKEPALSDCAAMGVLGPIPGVIGTLQAVEAIKLIAGCGESLTGRLLLVDTLSMRVRTLEVRKNPTCRVCAHR